MRKKLQIFKKSQLSGDKSQTIRETAQKRI